LLFFLDKKSILLKQSAPWSIQKLLVLISCFLENSKPQKLISPYPAAYEKYPCIIHFVKL